MRRAHLNVFIVSFSYRSIEHKTQNTKYSTVGRSPSSLFDSFYEIKTMVSMVFLALSIKLRRKQVVLASFMST